MEMKRASPNFDSREEPPTSPKGEEFPRNEAHIQPPPALAPKILQTNELHIWSPPALPPNIFQTNEAQIQSPPGLLPKFLQTNEGQIQSRPPPPKYLLTNYLQGVPGRRENQARPYRRKFKVKFSATGRNALKLRPQYGTLIPQKHHGHSASHFLGNIYRE